MKSFKSPTLSKGLSFNLINMLSAYFHKQFLVLIKTRTKIVTKS